jgi:hypothetical protein
MFLIAFFFSSLLFLFILYFYRTVPVAGSATVVLPFPASTPANAITITEGGATVWSNNAYVPGVTGVTGAQIIAGQSAIGVSVGSGSYSFALAV